MSTEFWDEREPNTPNDDVLGTAIQVWACMRGVRMQEGPCATVTEAADVFSVTARRAARAVVNHPWMFLTNLNARKLGCADQNVVIDREELLNGYSDEAILSMLIEHEGE